MLRENQNPRVWSHTHARTAPERARAGDHNTLAAALIGCFSGILRDLQILPLVRRGRSTTPLTSARAASAASGPSTTGASGHSKAKDSLAQESHITTTTSILQRTVSPDTTTIRDVARTLDVSVARSAPVCALTHGGTPASGGARTQWQQEQQLLEAREFHTTGVSIGK